MKGVKPPVWIVVLFAASLLPAAGRDILLITLDTVRADRLGCYGCGRATSPTLDALAREGVRFERAYTPVPITLPSHTVLLTGLLPRDAGVRDNLTDRLGEKVPAVAERLLAAGYHTAACVSAFVLDRRFGLARGFAVYDDTMTLDASGGDRPNERPAPATVDAAAAILRTAPADRPLFLWVHFYDPHHPYLPHAGTPPGLEPYDGEIRAMDRGVDRLLQAWRRSRTGLVIAVGDHGEMLGEHGEETHGVFLYESAVRVPLLMRADGAARGAVERAPVSTADVAATVLAFAGVAPDELWGRPLLAAGTPAFKAPHPALFFESFLPANSFGWTPPFGVLRDGWKYIHLPRPELFRPFEDPGEKRDRSGSDRSRARELLALLQQEYTTAYTPPAPPGGEALKRLESLGYRGGSVGGAARDPKDLIWIVAAMDRGERLERENREAEAEPLYRKILEANPENYTVLIKLGTLLQRGGRVEEARRYFRAARDLNPAFAHAHFNLASLDLAQGDVSAAEVGFRRAAELDPDGAEARLQLARLLINARRFPEADAVLNEVQRLAPEDPNLPFLWGLGAAGRGDMREAAGRFEEALRRKPDYADAAANLAMARFSLGEADACIRAYRLALRLDPERPESYLQLAAVLLHAREDAAGAAELFREFLGRFPGHPEAAPVRSMLDDLERPGP
jgi:arylsulfatase A-like enzyme/Tfp pilus assembly protein PilF